MLLENQATPAFIGIPRQRRPFLEALHHIEYGRFHITTPEGETMEFMGPLPGPDACLHLYDWNIIDEIQTCGEIGFADAYIAGRWDTPDLPALLTLALLNSNALDKFFNNNRMYIFWLSFRHWLHDRTSLPQKSGPLQDLDNNFYSGGRG